MKKLYLTGKKFGRWLVINPAEFSRNGHSVWTCKCDCGTIRNVIGIHLVNGNSISCGCYKSESTSKRLKKNLTGIKFGRLKVISGHSKHTNTKKTPKWLCKCSCGNTIIVSGDSLMSGNTKSCGCLRREIATGKNSRFWKGGVTKGRKKLLTRHKYRDWRNRVFKRDNWTCQVCGDNSGGNLNAHHIKPWIKYPKNRYEVNNGITLCKKCHKWVHSKLNIDSKLVIKNQGESK